MNSRERVHSVLSRQMPDRLPKEIKFVEPVHRDFVRRTGAADVTDYFGLDIREVYFKPSPVVGDFSPYYPAGLPAMPNQTGWEVGEWGVGQIPDTKTHFVEIVHPMVGLSDVDDLRKYPFPDFTIPERHQHLEKEVADYHAEGYFVVGFMEWTIFEIAWQMREIDNLFIDLGSNSEFAEYLLERITESRCFEAQRFAEAGVDMIRIGDDVGTQRGMMMDPEAFRRWFKPRYRRTIESARAVRPDLHVSYHSDGNCWDIIPDLVDVGVTVLNPVQPECMEIGKVKREFGDDLVFLGGIGTQTTMPFSSAKDVYESVQKTIDTLGPTGYFPTPTHVLEPEVPWENIEAYLRAVDEYGTH